MVKLVINSCHGGFGLSEEAEKQYRQYKMIEKDADWYHWDIPRDDPYLVQIVEKMGSDADGAFAKLKIINVPDDVEWQIDEYDGLEWVAEKHQTWS